MTRRALTQVGGRVELWIDDRNIGDLLAAALGVDSDESMVMQHVHGFHSYPARMHPVTAARLIEGMSLAGGAVLDPFAGSGTVLIEARLQGRRAFGIDANPLAVALARLKLFGLNAHQRELFLGAVDAVADYAESRRLAKAGPSRPYPSQQRAAFDPHILLELDGLSRGIELAAPADLASAFRLVLSALINKVSRRRSDTNHTELQRRLASGFAIRFFVRKARDLLVRLDDYSSRLPEGCPPAKMELGDARKLPLPKCSISTIITSPPYPGVYDYVEHHRLRLSWLQLDTKHLEHHEIGAHRQFANRSDGNAEAEWATQLGDCLDEMERVLMPSGTAVILIADSAVAGKAWYADSALREIAPRHGLVVVGGASQRRGHFHAPTRQAFRIDPRREHLIVLRRPERASRGSRDGSAQREGSGCRPRDPVGESRVQRSRGVLSASEATGTAYRPLSRQRLKGLC
jgi:DNA modification methylase